MHGLPGSINQTQYLDRFSVRTVEIDVYENTRQSHVDGSGAMCIAASCSDDSASIYRSGLEAGLYKKIFAARHTN